MAIKESAQRLGNRRGCQGGNLGHDGMKVDVEGLVYCTGPGGIWVLNPAGKHIGTILSENVPINMNWDDGDWPTLYFTGLTTINRIRLGIAGMPVPWISGG